MSHFIVRISEIADDIVKKVLPGYYSDRQQATEGVNKVLAEYPSHGQHEEYGYWWARDEDGIQFKFVISAS
jgi:hypothetical protein